MHNNVPRTAQSQDYCFVKADQASSECDPTLLNCKSTQFITLSETLHPLFSSLHTLFLCYSKKNNVPLISRGELLQSTSP